MTFMDAVTLIYEDHGAILIGIRLNILELEESERCVSSCACVTCAWEYARKRAACINGSIIQAFHVLMQLHSYQKRECVHLLISRYNVHLAPFNAPDLLLDSEIMLGIILSEDETLESNSVRGPCLSAIPCSPFFVCSSLCVNQ